MELWNTNQLVDEDLNHGLLDYKFITRKPLALSFISVCYILSNEIVYSISLQSTVASKFLALTELISKGCCRFVSFLEAYSCCIHKCYSLQVCPPHGMLWSWCCQTVWGGVNCWCFEKPTLGKDLDWVIAKPFPIY